MRKKNTASEKECLQEAEEKFWHAAVLRVESNFLTNFRKKAEKCKVKP